MACGPEPSLCPASACCIHNPTVSHIVAGSVITSTGVVSQGLCSSHPHSSLMLRRNRKSFPSLCHHAGIVSSHILTRRVSTAKAILRQTTFTLVTVYCHDHSFVSLVIVHLSLCLIYILNFIIGLDVEEKTVHIGFGAVCGFRHPLGPWNVSPADKGGQLCTHICFLSPSFSGFHGTHHSSFQCRLWSQVLSAAFKIRSTACD